MAKRDIVQADFHEEGPHQWVLNHRSYRIVVRKSDSSLEIIIRAKIDQDPNLNDWDTALKAINSFYKKLASAEGYTPTGPEKSYGE